MNQSRIETIEPDFVGEGGIASVRLSTMDVSTASAKPCKFTSLVFQRAVRWITEAFRTCQRIAMAIGRWSDPWTYPSAHSALVAQVLFTIVILGVFRLSVAW